jgi:hypothetical protein
MTACLCFITFDYYYPCVCLCFIALNFSARGCYACLSDVYHPKADSYSGGRFEDCRSRGMFCCDGPEENLGCTPSEVSRMISWQVVLDIYCAASFIVDCCLSSQLEAEEMSARSMYEVL